MVFISSVCITMEYLFDPRLAYKNVQSMVKKLHERQKA